MIRQAVQMSETSRGMFGAGKQPHETRKARAMRPSPSNHVVLQRKCACGGQGECDECGKKHSGWLQRHAAQGASPAAAPDVVHQALRGPGRQLDGATRRDMELRFGENFGDVRVHTDARAAESAKAVNAHAYTVGRDVVFAAQRYAPHTPQGRRLLAHELTHVVQQRGAAAMQTKLPIGAAGDRFEREADAIADAVARGTETAAVQLRTGLPHGSIQRDLATPPPAVTPEAKPDLTPEQIQAALRYNRDRYDEANTRLIQQLLGGPVTGTWNEENILAIAATQEAYGFEKKDGMVGHETFVFLNREQDLEGMPTADNDCLVIFRLEGPQETMPRARVEPTVCFYRPSFKIHAAFSERCKCRDFEYRQFISGRWKRTRNGVETDVPIALVGGVVPAAFAEDSNTADAVLHYGHRTDADQPTNQYINAAGRPDRANGCRYFASDSPGGFFDDCLAGNSTTSSCNSAARSGATAGSSKPKPGPP